MRVIVRRLYAESSITSTRIGPLRRHRRLLPVGARDRGGGRGVPRVARRLAGRGLR